MCVAQINLDVYVFCASPAMLSKDWRRFSLREGRWLELGHGQTSLT